MTWVGTGVKTVIRRMGNSQGVLIPKPLLAQVGLDGEADLSVENGTLVLRKPQRRTRRGWAEASKALAEAGDDELVWPEFANRGDAKLKW